MHEDPTLPRVDSIPCPNKECTRPARAPGSVVFIKYDAVNLKFLYSCGHCKRFWGPPELGDGYDPTTVASNESGKRE